MIPNAIASAAKRDTNGNAIHRLNSVGLTGFAMLDGLSRRCSMTVMMPFSESWIPLCVISVMLYVGSAWCIQVRLLGRLPGASYVVDELVPLLCKHLFNIFLGTAVQVREVRQEHLIVGYNGHHTRNRARICPNVPLAYQG
jgi:hypothetical protein